MSDFLQESNIFGDTTSPSAPLPEPASTATTIAGKLIDHLKWVADSATQQAKNNADWLAIASISGQNVGDLSLVRKSMTEPGKITPTDVIGTWKPVSLPDLLTLPAIPDDLNVDIDKIKSTWQPDLDALKTSWMAQLIPATTDLGIFTTLLSNVLGGTSAASADAKLTNLASTLTAALTAIKTTTLASVNSLATAMQTAITAAIATQSANISSATATSTDNTQNIAYARERDQVAREGARLEDEALTTFASRGFSLPAGVLANMTAHQRAETLRSASRVASEQASRIQGFLLDVSKITVESWQRTMELQARTQLDEFRAIADANLKYSELELSANRENAELAVKQLGLTLDFTKGAADIASRYRIGVIQGTDDLIRAYAALRGNETEYVRAVAGAKAQVLQALVDYFRAAIQSMDVGLRAEVANNDNAIRYINAAGSFIGTAVGNHVRAAAASLESFSRIAGMALSGLNAVASQTANG